MSINTDAIIDALAGADETGLTADMVARQLNTSHIGKVRGLLVELLRDETVSMENRRYTLRAGGGMKDIPINTLTRGGGKAREGEDRQTKPKAQKVEQPTDQPGWAPPGKRVPVVCVPPIRSIEDAEQAVERERMQNRTPAPPSGLADSLEQLEKTIKQPALPPLANPGTKLAMLAKFQDIFDQSIAVECRELEVWIKALMEQAGG